MRGIEPTRSPVSLLNPKTPHRGFGGWNIAKSAFYPTDAGGMRRIMPISNISAASCYQVSWVVKLISHAAEQSTSLQYFPNVVPMKRRTLITRRSATEMAKNLVLLYLLRLFFIFYIPPFVTCLAVMVTPLPEFVSEKLFGYFSPVYLTKNTNSTSSSPVLRR